VAGLAPPILHAGLARALSARRLFNLTVTNVPGSPEPLHAFGARLLRIIPVVPLAAEHALGIAVISYSGGLTFGLCADRTGMPDLDLFRDGLALALLELAAAARARTSD
jgi:diacylglycerol O-acyltransferase